MGHKNENFNKYIHWNIFLFNIQEQTMLEHNPSNALAIIDDTELDIYFNSKFSRVNDMRWNYYYKTRGGLIKQVIHMHDDCFNLNGNMMCFEKRRCKWAYMSIVDCNCLCLYRGVWMVCVCLCQSCVPYVSMFDVNTCSAHETYTCETTTTTDHTILATSSIPYTHTPAHCKTHQSQIQANHLYFSKYGK